MSDLDVRLAKLGVRVPRRRSSRLAARFESDGRECFDCGYGVKVKVGSDWVCARCRRAWWS